MMADSLCQFFSWAVGDMIFFSGDVQTTTIAVAITSSLCCSIVVAIVHVVALVLPRQQRVKTPWRYGRSNSTGSIGSKKSESSMWITGGKVNVPCVKCGKFFADYGCRFVTCQSCCFSVLSCQIHKKKSLTSTPCDTKQTEIDLSSAGMQSCPERLGFIGAQLTCLNLADNQLNKLPAEIGCLRGLQRLCLKHNQLSTLPVTIGSLVKLVNFDISHNQFTVIPECVTSLYQLQELRMTHNQFTEIPPEINKLKELLVLDISSNRLEVLCEELFSLIKLEYLFVKLNKFGSLPCAVGNLVRLTLLDLRGCGLTTLPHSIGKCSNLGCLKLDDNELQELPSQLSQLSNLQLLQLKHNKLQYLPAMLSFLLDSVTLCVEGNPLLSREDYSKYTQTPEQGPCLFPNLKELAAREIIKRNIPNTHTLPAILQRMLKTVSFCTKCGGPLFDFHSSKIIPHYVWTGSVTSVPLYQQLCSPHQPQHSCSC